MPTDKPTTIPAWLERAPAAGRPHLDRLYQLLREVAPHADEAIKWSMPFFVEPRFLFSFDAHKAHLRFMPHPAAQEACAELLEGLDTTKRGIRIDYADDFPEALVRQLAEESVAHVEAREDDGFW